MAHSITLSALSYATPDGTKLFNDLNLTIPPGLVGLVGRNGVGKTTLLRLLTRELRPQKGHVDAPARLFRLEQDPLAQYPLAQDPLAPKRTTLGAYLAKAQPGHEAPRADADIAQALDRVGLGRDLLHRPVDALSGGQRTRAALAVALLQRADYWLLDEPTNNLDHAGRHALFALLAQIRMGALIASHDPQLLDHMTAIVCLSASGARLYGGNYAQFLEIKRREDEAFAHDLAHAQKHLSHLKNTRQIQAERQHKRNARGKKAGKKGNQAKVLLGAMRQRAERTTAGQNRLATRQLDRATRDLDTLTHRLEHTAALRPRLASTEVPSGRVLLSASHLAIGYRRTTPLATELTLSATGPVRMAIAGPNGSGKTCLLRTLAGELAPLAGQITRNASLAFLAQNAIAADASSTPLAIFERRNPTQTQNNARAALARFGFRADDALIPFARLSGGQKVRAVLASAIGGTTPPQLLLLDEPTNHLDVKARAALIGVLNTYDGAILVASHDSAFLNAISAHEQIRLGL